MIVAKTAAGQNRAGGRGTGSLGTAGLKPGRRAAQAKQHGREAVKKAPERAASPHRHRALRGTGFDGGHSAVIAQSEGCKP
ncbi:hypothetical protein A9Q95_09715 [Rhodobacterales bacterium 59_46_T64]|nr:hypothetical protein A9Q95_09715 [Rhodobacterales bacterium 59_46_T64]